MFGPFNAVKTDFPHSQWFNQSRFDQTLRLLVTLKVEYPKTIELMCVELRTSIEFYSLFCSSWLCMSRGIGHGEFCYCTCNPPNTIFVAFPKIFDLLTLMARQTLVPLHCASGTWSLILCTHQRHNKKLECLDSSFEHQRWRKLFAEELLQVEK